jgi:hypothetical protein
MSPADDTPTEGGFLSRWAKRKQEAKVAPQPELELETAPAQPPAVQPEPDAVELPLPSLDDIVPGSDVSAFFAKHVPESLRTAALRKLWVTDPQIRDFIEMADYQWDFNNPDSIPGWSSKLTGVDVKAMAARILNFGEPPEERAEPDVEAHSTAPAEPPPALGENPEFSTKPDASPISAPVEEDAPAAHAAVQNNPSSSSVYASVRKRHGGALPT